MGSFRRGRDGLFDLEDSKALWANRDPDKALQGQLGAAAVAKFPAGENGAALPPETSLSRARTAQAALRAQREHLALQKTKGEIIKTDDAFRACRAVVGIVIERLDGAAAQIGARVVGLDAVAAERVAREVLTAVRTEIAAMSNSIQEVVDGNSIFRREAARLARSLLEAFAPPPATKVSEWAAAHRILSRGNAEPGRWSNDRAPYLTEVMDAVNDDAASSAEKM